MPHPVQQAADGDDLTASYGYLLPPSQIAQTPLYPRDQARLLVVTPTQHSHSCFADLPQWLCPGDLLVLNDTKVIPARLYGQKNSGARIETLLLEQLDEHTWLALVKPGRRLKLGDRIVFAANLEADVVGLDPASGGRLLRFIWPDQLSFSTLLEQLGEIPFPPYIQDSSAAPDEYQTVWATHPGSVAAPTAGLHFTTDLLERLANQGIQTATITLTIGLDTFRPVEAERVQDHQIHREWMAVPETTVAKILATQAEAGRVIAVGTTVARAVETAAQRSVLQPWRGKTDLFIYPGYRWRVLDGLITNFHLPRSSLLMLVSALIGRQRLLQLYAEAIQQQYRFYSFGDGMLILPEAIRPRLGAEGSTAP
ncbi:MAG: tRNA preQ1(34) S-adenosylmethionine ribosyltransferase-isomerase QueA [Synechococcaceae cyanobacterium SM2_3_1]|nr:tRNA preQ1(34) S-adenosylmethionine ribosyltransferase-isomerase QueA [Synechococcaceae cyanobacterium SM2_3_1]